MPSESTSDKPTSNAPTDQLVVRAQMLIRRPAAEVFDAFVNPAVTTRFWFTKSSGPLEVGQELLWEWEMYGAAGKVMAKEIEPGRRILIAWDEPSTHVEWTFNQRADQTTVVEIANWGFQGTDEEILAAAVDAKGGFTQVLAGLKALLEHDLELNLVADNYPSPA